MKPDESVSKRPLLIGRLTVFPPFVFMFTINVENTRSGVKQRPIDQKLKSPVVGLNFRLAATYHQGLVAAEIHQTLNGRHLAHP